MARQSGLSEAGLSVESALAKIERVLPTALRERLRALQEIVWAGDDIDEILVEADIVSTLSLASQQRRQVHIQYESADEAAERDFDPYSVVYHNDHWYTVGYCHLRRDLRTFRLDRIETVELLDTRFVPPPDFDALGYMLDSFRDIKDRWDIEVLLDMPLDDARRKIPRSLASLKQDGEQVRLHSSMPDLDEFARTLVALGCPVTIVQPTELREAFVKLAEAMTRIAQQNGE
jgi:predicted DNA-binding transcriptional regulator YafY